MLTIVFDLGHRQQMQADSKYQQGSTSGCRQAIASSWLMPWDTAWMPARID